MKSKNFADAVPPDMRADQGTVPSTLGSGAGGVVTRNLDDNFLTRPAPPVEVQVVVYNALVEAGLLLQDGFGAFLERPALKERVEAGREGYARIAMTTAASLIGSLQRSLDEQTTDLLNTTWSYMIRAGSQNPQKVNRLLRQSLGGEFRLGLVNDEWDARSEAIAEALKGEPAGRMALGERQLERAANEGVTIVRQLADHAALCLACAHPLPTTPESHDLFDRSVSNAFNEIVNELTRRLESEQALPALTQRVAYEVRELFHQTQQIMLGNGREDPPTRLAGDLLGRQGFGLVPPQGGGNLFSTPCSPDAHGWCQTGRIAMGLIRGLYVGPTPDAQGRIYGIRAGKFEKTGRDLLLNAFNEVVVWMGNRYKGVNGQRVEMAPTSTVHAAPSPRLQ